MKSKDFKGLSSSRKNFKKSHGGSKFTECIVCGKCIATHAVELHTNECLDTKPATRSALGEDSIRNKPWESKNVQIPDPQNTCLKNEKDLNSVCNPPTLHHVSSLLKKRKLTEVDDYKKNEENISRKPKFNFLQEVGLPQSKLTFSKGFLKNVVNNERIVKVSVLIPGMVLFRNALPMDLQQNLVKSAQDLTDYFRQSTTTGGGMYHVYSACWGAQWDGTTLSYVQKFGLDKIPDWLFELAQRWAIAAHKESPIFHENGPVFEPDIGLVNYYPARDQNLGKIGIGGHQDLDNALKMPVVSFSVGDSMTFFYRRLPPFSRRKSGICLKLSGKEKQECRDGDASSNLEKQIVLNSGDVLVFGGASRLVFHGTRDLKPGTKPPGLQMCPGRLNFTFRQRDKIGTIPTS